LDSAYKGILPDEEVKVRDTPFRRFYVPESDLSPMGQNEESMYRKVANKISGNNTLIKQYWELSGLIRQIKQMEGMLDELQGQAQKDLEIEIAGLKRDLIGKYRGDAKPDATPQKAPKH
jgi:hypothetical protein